MGIFTRGKTSGNNSHAGTSRQCDLGRTRSQNTLYRGKHQHLSSASQNFWRSAHSTSLIAPGWRPSAAAPRSARAQDACACSSLCSVPKLRVQSREGKNADPSTHHPQTEKRLGPPFAQDDRSIYVMDFSDREPEASAAIPKREEATPGGAAPFVIRANIKIRFPNIRYVTAGNTGSW